MVGFSIQVNEKTNHKFPVTGYGNEGKFEHRGNPLYAELHALSPLRDKPSIQAIKIADSAIIDPDRPLVCPWLGVWSGDESATAPSLLDIDSGALLIIMKTKDLLCCCFQ